MKKGKLINVIGDVTNPQFTGENEVAVICHVCNNGTDDRGIGVMGAGVALALKNKWPKVYEVYKKMEKCFPSGLKEQLGNNCYAKVNNNIVIVNMIAQNLLMSQENPKPLKYKSLISCMVKVLEYVRMVQFQTDNKVVIHCPEFGGLRAGGNFEFVKEIINEIWIENGVDVTIYKFEEK